MNFHEFIDSVFSPPPCEKWKCETCNKWFIENEIQETKDGHVFCDEHYWDYLSDKDLICLRCGSEEIEKPGDYCEHCMEKMNERDSQQIYDSLSIEEQRNWDRAAAGGWQ